MKNFKEAETAQREAPKHPPLEELKESLRKSPVFYRQYLGLTEERRKDFEECMTGRKTLPFTYDPFFKYIFNPDMHPKRLARFLSAILKQKVRIVKILPQESSLIDYNGSLLIMDIIVQLADGATANVEIQKSPYQFTAGRLSCYSSDLVMRQYNRVKAERKKASYKDLRKVYTIVIYEESPEEMKRFPEYFIHHGAVRFDTGLSMELLQEYYLIGLDVFHAYHYNEAIDELHGWISFLCTRDTVEAGQLELRYPWLADLYRDAEELSRDSKEVLNMWSEALRILDQNTAQYMIEEQEEEIKKQKEVLKQQGEEIKKQGEEIKKRVEELKKQDEELRKQDEELRKQDEELKKQDAELKKQDEELKKQDEELKKQDEELKKQDEKLKKQNNELEKQNETIRNLKQESLENSERIRNSVLRYFRKGEKVEELSACFGIEKTVIEGWIEQERRGCSGQ